MTTTEEPLTRAEAKAEAAAAKARAKAMRPWFKKKRFILPLALVVIIVLAVSAGGGGTKEEDDSSSSADRPATSSTGSQDVYQVGQVAHTGDFDVTVHAVEDPLVPTNEFESASAGNRLVAVEVEVTNTGDERQTISTLMGAELIDSQNRPWNITIAATDRPQLDGEVVPGASRRGWIAFEVANDSEDLKIRIKGNLTAQGSLFDLDGK